MNAPPDTRAVAPGDSPPLPANAVSPAPAPLPRGGTSAGDVALVVLAVLATFYTLEVASAIFMPLMLALLLTLVLSPAVRGMRGLGVPEPAGAAIVVLGLVAAVGLGVYMLFDPATEWMDKAPRVLNRAEWKMRGIRESMEDVSRAAKKVEDIARVERPSPAAPKVETTEPSLVSRILTGTQAVLVSAASTVVLLYFLLASGDMFLRKLVRVLPTLTDKKRAVEAARAIQSDMGRYLLTITCINAALGAVSALALHLLGMPNPVLWGVMVALLNFLPYLGAATSLGILSAAAFLTFDDVSEIFAVPAVFFVLTTLEGQFVTPILTGRRLALNPVVIFVSMLVWAWLWGVIGALMAVPILMTLRILCEHVESLEPLGEFLSGRRGESVD